MAMDAGNFSNIKKTGGLQPKKAQQTAPNGPKEGPSVQQDPTESVQLGNQPVAKENVDTGGKERTAPKPEQAPSTIASTTSFPNEVAGLGFVAGPSTVTGKLKSSTSVGLTGVHGLNSTTLSGVTKSDVGPLASVNPLQPKATTKPPTTSLSAINGFAEMGETGEMFYLSGNHVSV